MKQRLKDHLTYELMYDLPKKVLDKLMKSIDEFLEHYQPERLNPEALDDKRLYNDDGTLHNPGCPVCGIARHSSLHQGCDSPNSEYK